MHQTTAVYIKLEARSWKVSWSADWTDAIAELLGKNDLSRGELSQLPRLSTPGFATLTISIFPSRIAIDNRF